MFAVVRPEGQKENEKEQMPKRKNEMCMCAVYTLDFWLPTLWVALYSIVCSYTAAAAAIKFPWQVASHSAALYLPKIYQFVLAILHGS